MWLGGYLSIFLCLVITFRPHFHSDYSPPPQVPGEKDQPGYKYFHSKHTELPASSFSITCVLKHVCMRLINILTGSKINHKIKIADTGQLAVGISPLDCNYTFLSFPKMLTALTICMGREGGSVKR